MQCKRCGSHAINPHMHGRQKGADLDLCDVCYWRKRADELVEALEDLMAQQNGPPLSLPRHAERWQKAMDEAQSALAKAKEVS